LSKRLAQIEANPDIVHIVWGEQYMQRRDVNRFITLLQSRPQVMTLTYLGCDAAFPGMIAKILCTLLTHPTLETLELFDHNIGGEGLLALASFMLESKTLKLCRLIPGPSYRRPDAYNIAPEIAAQFRATVDAISGRIKFEGPSFLGGADQDIYSCRSSMAEDGTAQD
jgi:hypothetical protein